MKYPSDLFTAVRGAPLPFVLFAFNGGAYFLAALIAFFMEGGISESEEWRIFVVGWLVIPVAGLAAAFGTVHLKRTYYADSEGFYPLLLAANAVFWVAYFAYFFPPPWLYQYAIAPRSLLHCVWLMPLVNLVALALIKRGDALVAKRPLNGLYAFLPLAALYVGINFSGFQIVDPDPMHFTWPTIQPQGDSTEYKVAVTEGRDVDAYEAYPLNTRIASKVTGVLQATLPWSLLADAKLTAWHVEEGEWVEPNSVLAEFESDFLRTEIIARIPILLKEKVYSLGEEAEPGRALGRYYSQAAYVQSQTEILYLALVLALVSLLFSRSNPLSAVSLPTLAIDGVVVLAIILLVLDLDYVYDAHHYNFFLGPINDVLRGKTMLVDINCQYGVGVIYFLALFFKVFPIPFNYQGFSLLLSILLVLQYILLYVLMRRILLWQFSAVVALLLIVAASYYSQLEAILPSTGPLRFGLSYILLALFVARSHAGMQRWVQIAIYALVGLSSVWSVESFTYTIAAYLCSEFYVLLWNPRELRHKARQLLPVLGGPAIAIAICHLLLALFTYGRAGVWPEWSYYLDYLALYSIGEFGTFTVEPWRPWALYMAVYFLSLLLLLHKALFTPLTDAAPFAFIAGLTGFGIAQFTYYLGRSHYNNLYHICVPLIIVSIYWFLFMRQSSRSIPRGFVGAATYCLCVAGFVLLAKTAPDFVVKWPRSPLGRLLGPNSDASSPWTAGPTQGEVEDALTLIERHAADRERVALFLPPELTTETLMLSQKAHIFPLSNPRQDELLPAVGERAKQFAHGLQGGDYLFVTRNIRSLSDIQNEVANKILSQLHGVRIDSTEHVNVIRLLQANPTNP